MGIRDFFDEWSARRKGRRTMQRAQARTGISREAREIVGPTGLMTTRGWESMESGGKAYVESFDRRLPPSLFVSERDRTRHGQAIPVAERCIEDWNTDVDEQAAESAEVDAELRRLDTPTTD